MDDLGDWQDPTMPASSCSTLDSPTQRTSRVGKILRNLPEFVQR